MTTAAVAPGFEFVHATMLEPDWRPGPGEKYADAPKARCVVTSVQRGAVYFTAKAYGPPWKGHRTLALDRFVARYATPQEAS